jgi:CRISPR/Cas system-associated exonuclease Cas4 (RecB family)
MVMPVPMTVDRLDERVKRKVRREKLDTARDQAPSQTLPVIIEPMTRSAPISITPRADVDDAARS